MSNSSTRNVLIAFIASPGDVTAERSKAREVVEELNHSLKSINWQIDLLGWEDTLPGASRPQELINKDVDACHLFIGVLWRRWGSFTGEYSSGFEEEFERARKRCQETKSPERWLAFKEIDSETLKDPGEQLKKVIEFRKEQIKLREVLFKDFTDIEDWAKQLNRWLLKYVLELAGSTQVPKEESDSKSKPQQKEDSEISFDSENNEKQAFFQIETIANKLASFAESNKTNKANEDTILTLIQVARLQLYTTAITSSQVSGEVLSNHDINFIYLAKEEILPTEIERRLLFRTVVGSESSTAPSWYWFTELTKEDLEQLLFDIASTDTETTVRKQAINILKDADIRPSSNEFYEKAKLFLKDNDSEVRRAGIAYFGKILKKKDLSVIKNLFEDEDYWVKRDARNSYIKTLITINPNKAFKETLNDNFYIDFEKLLPEFQKHTKNIKKETLIEALNSYNSSVELFVLKELFSRNSLNTVEIRSSLEKLYGEAKNLAYLQLLKDGENIDLGQLIKDYKEIDVWSYYKETSYPDEEPDDFVLSLYQNLPPEIILEKVDFYSSNESYLILKALAINNFELISNLIRENLEDNYETLKVKSSKKIIDKYGNQGKEIVETYKHNVIDFLKEGFVVVSLGILAVYGNKSDINFARKYINNSKDSIRFEAIRIIERFGNASDVDSLITITESNDEKLRNFAAKTALKLSPKISGVTQTFLQSNNSNLVRLAIKSLWNKNINVVRKQIEPLLLNANDSIRLSALAWVINKYSEEELKNLLKSYLSNRTYYYNVVCWLDRKLFAPRILRDAYTKQLETIVS